MTSKKNETASRPQKPPILRAHVRIILNEVKDTLFKKALDIDLTLITESVIREALRWKSAYEGRINASDDWVPLLPDHQAKNISRYLPRNLRKLETSQPPQQQLAAPMSRELNSAHGVAYALALTFGEDAKRAELVRTCRQHYWGSDTAPFPWISPHGRNQRGQAFEDGHSWLGARVKDDGSGILTVQGKIRSKHVRQTESAVATLITRLGNDKSWSQESTHSFIQAENVLSPMADILNQHGAEFIGIRLSELTAASIAITWDEKVLCLDGYYYRISDESLLSHLHQTCVTLAQYPGWTEKTALAFILTDDPPVHEISATTTRINARRPKALSFDHIALLQLLYMTPAETWSVRLYKWDEWLRLFPEEGFTKRFQHRKQGELPTSELQRQAWIRTESQRALRRALAFIPYIKEREERPIDPFEIR